MVDRAVPDRGLVARMTAGLLLQIGAVHFASGTPFTLTSGRTSPVYVDCRKLISYPTIRETLTDFSVAAVLREAGADTIDVVAGGETAGIPFAAWIAQRMALPMVYVRKKPKGFGRDARIEGAAVTGRRVLLVEDLSTDGGSKIGFADALRAAGATVDHVSVVFDYDIFAGSKERLAGHGLRLHALATWRDVLDVAGDEGAIPQTTLADLARYIDDPSGWSDAHRAGS